MRAIIGAKLLSSSTAQPAQKPFEIRDKRLRGFLLRVQPSGVRSYYAQYGRGKRNLIGRVGEFTPDEARDRCEKILGNVAHGRDPMFGIVADTGPTLKAFVEDTYAPWLRANRPKTADANLKSLERCFGDWYEKPLTAITTELIEDWRIERLNNGIAPATVLRDIGRLGGLMKRAVKLKKITEHPGRNVDKPRVDRSPNVRFLDAAEEKHLRDALAARDAQMRDARDSANDWRRKRKQEQLPPLPHYGDHLTPAVLVSMHTGVRRGELLALKWKNVDLGNKRQITIEGNTAKSSQTRHIPLNDEALAVLKNWKSQAPDEVRVFPVDTSFKTAWGSLLERAKIEEFRWHDLRHHFASRLAQAGVPLNTIRDLLGHGSMAMVLRYAHLAPDQKREAVAKLVQAA